MVGRSTWGVLQLVKGLMKPIAELMTSNWKVGNASITGNPTKDCMKYIMLRNVRIFAHLKVVFKAKKYLKFSSLLSWHFRRENINEKLRVNVRNFRNFPENFLS